jgi:ABC-type maltose transport system permease subunit
MAATVLVNLAPPNPYAAATLKVWGQGHFLNFNGLAQFVAALWPFVALLYLIHLAARRERD